MIKPTVLKNSVSSVGSPIHIHSLAASNLSNNEVADARPDLLNILGKSLIRRMTTQSKSVFMSLHQRYSVLDRTSSLVANECAETTTVHIVGFDVEYFQSMPFQEFLHRSQGIVLQVLVTDVIEAVLFQHCRQVVLLHCPDSIRGQNFRDVCDESIGILKIVKHCNTGYYLGLPFTKFALESLGAKEVVEDLVSSVAGFLNEILGGLESDQKQSFGRV